jgi:hypothetical protein
MSMTESIPDQESTTASVAESADPDVDPGAYARAPGSAPGTGSKSVKVNVRTLDGVDLRRVRRVLVGGGTEG